MSDDDARALAGLLAHCLRAKDQGETEAVRRAAEPMPDHPGKRKERDGAVRNGLRTAKRWAERYDALSRLLAAHGIECTGPLPPVKCPPGPIPRDPVEADRRVE